MSEFITALQKIVGPAYVLTATTDIDPYVTEWRGRYKGQAHAVVKPATTEEVAAIVKLCAATRTPIVPQGGNTGLVGGGIAYDAHSVVLNLSRMNRIIDVDAANFTMTVEAGCIIATLQQAAIAADRLFPFSLGSEGSCQIGGCIATNAGGILTLKYGNMRALVLGLEAVLPNGDIWNGLRRLRKDNSGYDLKHLFVGAEGTLGIITKAVVTLAPRPMQTQTFFAALITPDDAVTLLSEARHAFGDALSAFEIIPRLGIDLALACGLAVRDPLTTKTPWTILVELSGGQDATLQDRVMDFLGAMLEKTILVDATIAQNEQQRRDLWFIREAIVEAQRHSGGSIKHDISVPISDIPRFIAEATALVEGKIAGVRPVIFGHIGDGNLHANLTQPENADTAEFLAQWDAMNHAVHDIVYAMNGSIAAEHGVGTFKRDELKTRKSAVEIALMRTIKHALDPDNIMNPGVIL